MEERQPTAQGVTCKLVGENGNVFNLIALVCRAMRTGGYGHLENEFKDACFKATSYDEVLMIIQRYVEVI